nr:MAG TPA: hypothetical protein [Caudoviricetes sp.]
MQWYFNQQIYCTTPLRKLQHFAGDFCAHF